MVELAGKPYFILTLDEIGDLDIINGLKKGKYTQIGGVIRDNTNKQIVAHLRDVGEPIKIKEIFQNHQLAKTAHLQYLDLGLGIMNLSATAISTLYLARRLEEIEKKIDKVLSLLERVYEEIQTIKNIIIHRSLVTALNRYQHIDTFTDNNLKMDELKKIRDGFEEAVNTLNILLNTINKDKNIANELVYLIRLYILATEGLAKVYLDLNQTNTAYSKYEKSLEVIRGFNKLFIELCRNHNFPVPPEIRIEFKNNVRATRFIKGRLLELEYINKNSIPFNEWKKLTDGLKDNIYLIKEK